MAYTVSELSKMSGVTVRTLHHYDEIGLVSPAGRTASGYRQYSRGDVERLQTVLFYRELGFPLKEISRIVTQPDFARLEALADQRRRLQVKKRSIDSMLKSVDMALVAAEQGVEMSSEDMLSPFGEFDAEKYGFDPAGYQEEVEHRWGDTDAYKESRRRTSAYTEKDWDEVMAEMEEISERLAELKRSDADPEGSEAMDAAESHRRHIDRRYYPCSSEMHDGLGEMYVADVRFTKTWDDREPGLAAFVRDAFAANAVRQS